MPGRRVRIWDVAPYFTKDNLSSVVTNAVIALDLKQEDDNKTQQHVSHSEGESIFCTSCQVSIPDNSHYKTDWHVLNAKLRAVGAKPVSQNEFQQLELENDLGDEEELIEERANQVSTASSSSSLDIQAQTGSARITFITKDNTTLAVWKTVLLPGKSGTVGQFAHAALSLSEPIHSSFPKTLPTNSKGEANVSSGPALTPSAIAALPQHPFQWIILLCQGGFFAGAVFRGDQVLKHKRIAKYTVRRKQGGSQASKDQSKGGIHSAGASIRRQNEVRLREEIAELLKNWNVEIAQSSRIFIHAPSFNSTSFYFEGSPISRRDPRVRSIPIVTERPSFVELQRIHLILSTVEIATFEGMDALRSSMELAQASISAKSETSSIADLSEAASMRSSASSIYSLTEGEHANWANEGATKSEKSEKDKVDLLAIAIDKNDEAEVRRLINEEEYVYPIPDKAEDMVWPLMRAVQLSNISMVRCLLECGEPLDDRSPKYGLKTALHAAAEASKDELVELFLEEGANPTIHDIHGRTAYECCKEKSTRNLMRKFAGANAELWKWEAQARIPPLTDEMEEHAKAKEAEKRRKKKAAQKERKKVAKAEEEASQAEEAEKMRAAEELNLARSAAYERTKRILNMSEREKRALAAERRLNPNANTCDNCGSKITGEPFERFSFKYCSSECVVEHKRILDTLQASSSSK